MGSLRVRRSVRGRYVFWDCVALVWVAALVGLAWAVKYGLDTAADLLAEGGTTVSSLATRIDDVAAALGEVPLVGDQLADSVEPISVSLGQLAIGTADQVAVLHTAAWVLSAVTLIMPLVPVLGLYLAPRLRGVRQAVAARTAIGDGNDLDLFALRAMANAPMADVARISSDPVAAWRSGDRHIIAQLANLELKRVGIGVVVGDSPAAATSQQNSPDR
ncbi:MAG: hypothetical protein ACK5KO_02940 [Arachnia sp.]